MIQVNDLPFMALIDAPQLPDEGSQTALHHTCWATETMIEASAQG